MPPMTFMNAVWVFLFFLLAGAGWNLGGRIMGFRTGPKAP
jgi:hypothetical protein